MQVIWDEEKNTLLKSTRNISFEDIESAILNDKILDIIPHHNTDKYPNQELLIIEFAAKNGANRTPMPVEFGHSCRF